MDNNPDLYMVEYLKQNGWKQLWHVDNWVQSNKHYTNIDYAGVSTLDAYERAKLNETN